MPNLYFYTSSPLLFSFLGLQNRIQHSKKNMPAPPMILHALIFPVKTELRFSHFKSLGCYILSQMKLSVSNCHHRTYARQGSQIWFSKIYCEKSLGRRILSKDTLPTHFSLRCVVSKCFHPPTETCTHTGYVFLGRSL